MRQKQAEETARAYLNRQLHEANLLVEQWLSFYLDHQNSPILLSAEQQPELKRLIHQAESLRNHYRAYLEYTSPHPSIEDPTSPVSVNELLRQLTKSFQAVVEKKSQFLNLDVPEGVEVHGSSELIWSILYLSLEFVVRHSKAGQIKISAEQKDNTALLGMHSVGLG